MGSRKASRPEPIDLDKELGKVTGRFRAEREQDLALGREAAQKQFADVSASETRDVIERRKQQTEGLTPEERQALEQDALGGIQQAEQTALRQLRGAQGAAGVTGALRSGQQADIIQEGLQARGQAQRDVFLQDIAARRGALDALESSLSRERAGFVAREFGEASLGAAERGAALQFLAGQKQAQMKGGKK